MLICMKTNPFLNKNKKGILSWDSNTGPWILTAVMRPRFMQFSVLNIARDPTKLFFVWKSVILNFICVQCECVRVCVCVCVCDWNKTEACLYKSKRHSSLWLVMGGSYFYAPRPQRQHFLDSSSSDYATLAKCNPELNAARGPAKRLLLTTKQIFHHQYCLIEFCL